MICLPVVPTIHPYTHSSRLLDTHRQALIVFTETLDSLVDQDRVLSMQLTYNDTAPAKYEPAFFRAAAQDGSDRLTMDEGAIRVKIGAS